MNLGSRHASLAVDKNKATLFGYRLTSLTGCSLVAFTQYHFSTPQNISTIHLIFLIAKVAFM